MTSIKVGDRYLYKVLDYYATVTEVKERSIWLRFDFGEGKCGLLIGIEHVDDALIKYTPPEE